MKLLSRLFPALFFFCLIIFTIFIPFFRKGYIFAYDELLFYPKIPYKLSFLIPNQTYFLFLLEKLSYIFPTWVIQRFIWFAAFYIGALGCFYLFKKNKLSGYLAGIFFIFNPFVYERMVMGQVTIILGSALSPWVIVLLRRYFGGEKTIFFILASVLAGLGIIIFPHNLFILNFLIFPVFFVNAVKQRRYLKNFLLFFLYLIIILAINLNWIVPPISTGSRLDTLSSGFNSDDFEFYSTSKGKVGNIWFNILTLNGHWAERENFYKYHLDSSLSRFSSCFILVFVAVGVCIGLTRKDKRLFCLLAMTGTIVVCVLAVGGRNVNFLYLHLPFYKSMREPQKWVIVMVLICIYFLNTFYEFISEKLNKRKIFQTLAIVFLVVLPILNTNQILWGFNGQLKVADYPKSWYDINYLFSKEKEDFKIWFLPGHFYIDLEFAGRKVINPALGFFDKFTYIGNDIDVGNTYEQIYKEDLDNLVDQEVLILEKNCPDTATLKKLSIKYLILAKENDWEKYIDIKRCTKLELMNDFPDLFLFKIEAS